MWLQLLLLLVGFIALVWSADKFLSGAASTAVNFGIPKIVIGLTIVALGTSAPEIIVAIFAALDGNHLLAVGNALGSNIANIGLVLGITAIITPLAFSKNVRRKELPWLLGATTLTLVLLFDRDLSFTDGLISKYSYPSLTTVKQHAEEIGRVAAAKLIDRLNREDLNSNFEQTVIKSVIIEREST